MPRSEMKIVGGTVRLRPITKMSYPQVIINVLAVELWMAMSCEAWADRWMR